MDVNNNFKTLLSYLKVSCGKVSETKKIEIFLCEFLCCSTDESYWGCRFVWIGYEKRIFIQSPCLHSLFLCACMYRLLEYECFSQFKTFLKGIVFYVMEVLTIQSVTEYYPLENFIFLLKLFLVIHCDICPCHVCICVETCTLWPQCQLVDRWNLLTRPVIGAYSFLPYW